MQSLEHKFVSSVTERRYYVFAIEAIRSALSLHILFLILFLFSAIPQLAVLNIASVLTYLYLLKLAKQRRYNLTSLLASIEVILHAVIVSLYIGWDSGFSYYFLIVAPLIAFNNYAKRSVRLLGSIAVIISYLLADFWLRHQAPLISMPDFYIDIFHLLNVAIFLIGMTYLVFVYTGNIGTAEKHYYKVATTDLLTGLRNRRHLIEIASHEIARMDRASQPLSLLLCDIDYFKKINSKYGREFGDALLIQVTQRLIYGLRTHDVLARWGGEEFLAILPNADIAAASEVAERLRQIISEQPFVINQFEIPVTMTFGVRQFSVGEVFDDCVAKVEKSLNDGKRQGRNRVELSQ